MASDLTPANDTDAARFLLRAKFSASPADISEVRELGYRGWLERQFASPRGQTGAEWLDAAGYGAIREDSSYFWPQFGDHMIWNQLLAQPDETRQRLAFALSQFVVVSLNPIDGFWPPYVMAGWWDVLTRNAFGNFRTLLEEVTLNYAMGMYLNTRGNLKEDPASGRQPDENYAREIMQLFTIGLHELNPDGTPRLDAAGKPIETYGQDDVTQLARVFTGYDRDMSRVKYTPVEWQSYPVISPEFCSDPMVLDPAKHSTLAVDFLGTHIPAGTDGMMALEKALDHLFAHSNVGPFFATQMIQRLVTSNPSPAYVARVSAAFDDNGEGVRGDLKAVWHAVLTDPEALAPSDPETGGKLREPVLRYVGWARTVGIASESGKWGIFDLSNAGTSLGQSPLRSPSVFNFFRPGYAPPKTAIAEAGMVAPEFQIANETSIAGYTNFLQWAIHTGYGDVKPTYETMLPFAHDAHEVVRWLNLHLAAGQLSSDSCALIEGAVASLGVTPDSDEGHRKNAVASACLLVMCAPEYLVQK